MAETYSENDTVVGYFDDHQDAERAVQALREAGFSSAHLGVAHRGDTPSSTSTSTSLTDSGESHSGDGVSVWSKVKNFFEGGDTAEPYADERSQGDMANREVTANPADSYQYGTSDVHQSLNEMSVPEERSKYFGHRFSSGENGAVVTVKAAGRAHEAESILEEHGADIGDEAEDYDYSATPKTEDTQNIQLLGEVLRVHKDRVERGEVRVRKDVITETQTIQVPVTREELVIERRPATGTMQANQGIGQSQEIRIPLTEERASVDKSTLVREEVSIGKKPVSEVRDLTSDVRHEELVVDDQTKRAVNQ